MRVDGGGFNDVFYGDDRLDEMMEDDMLMDNQQNDLLLDDDMEDEIEVIQQPKPKKAKSENTNFRKTMPTQSISSR